MTTNTATAESYAEEALYESYTAETDDQSSEATDLNDPKNAPDSEASVAHDRRQTRTRNAGAAGFVSGGSPKISTVHNKIDLWNILRLDREVPRVNLNCQRLTSAAVDYVFGGHHPLEGINISFITSSMQRRHIGVVPTIREHAVKFTVPNRKTGYENQFVSAQTIRSAEGSKVSSRNLIMVQYDMSAAILRLEVGQFLLLSYSKNRNMQFVAVFKITDLHELSAVDKSLVPDDLQNLTNHYLVNACVVAAAMKTPAKNEQRWFEGEDSGLMEDLIAQAYHKLDNPNDITGVERVWKGAAESFPTDLPSYRVVDLDDLPYVIANTTSWMRDNEIATKEREAGWTRKIYARLTKSGDDDSNAPMELEVFITSTLNSIESQYFVASGTVNDMVFALSDGDYRPVAEWISDNASTNEASAMFMTSL